MIHNEPHPLAGELVNVEGQPYRIEDWWDRVSGDSWMVAVNNGNPAAYSYAARTLGSVPMDDEVVYGKLGPFGHLVHVTELGT